MASDGHTPTCRGEWVTGADTSPRAIRKPWRNGLTADGTQQQEEIQWEGDGNRPRVHLQRTRDLSPLKAWPQTPGENEIKPEADSAAQYISRDLIFRKISFF